jgi:hypothetical protein
VGDRHKALIQQLEARTGWPITVRQQPNPIAIAEVAKETVPATWGFTGQHRGRRKRRFESPSSV